MVTITPDDIFTVIQVMYSFMGSNHPAKYDSSNVPDEVAKPIIKFMNKLHVNGIMKYADEFQLLGIRIANDGDRVRFYFDSLGWYLRYSYTLDTVMVYGGLV